jgi:hypothetical protein
MPTFRLLCRTKMPENSFKCKGSFAPRPMSYSRHRWACMVHVDGSLSSRRATVCLEECMCVGWEGEYETRRPSARRAWRRCRPEPLARQRVATPWSSTNTQCPHRDHDALEVPVTKGSIDNHGMQGFGGLHGDVFKELAALHRISSIKDINCYVRWAHQVAAVLVGHPLQDQFRHANHRAMTTSSTQTTASGQGSDTEGVRR